MPDAALTLCRLPLLGCLKTARISLTAQAVFGYRLVIETSKHAHLAPNYHQIDKIVCTITSVRFRNSAVEHFFGFLMDFLGFFDY